MAVTLTKALESAIWAQTLNSGELAEVEAQVVERVLPAGSYACRDGEPVTHWIGVIEGLVKLSVVSPQGKSATLAGVPSGGWFGEGSLLRTETRRYDAVALRESRVAYMPRATFQHLLDTNIGFNRFLLNQLNERLGQFIGMVEHERLLNPEGRVARCLASLFNTFLYPGVTDRLTISQEEIGYLSGVSRQRVNQALHALELARLLRVEYGGVVVLDPQGLRTYGA